MLSTRNVYLGSGLFLAAMWGALPTPASAATCSNAHLSGTYNVQVTNASFLNVLGALNAAASKKTPATQPPGSLGDNPSSLGGSMPGLGRYFLNGNGVIIGQKTTTSGAVMNANIGSYTVNIDCTATLRLESGQTFNATVVAGGSRVLFMQSDTNGAGIAGSMERVSNSCLARVGAPQSFGFMLTGVQKLSASGDAEPPAPFGAYSTLGSLQLGSDGGFKLSGWIYSNGASQSVNASGTYAIGLDCSLRLTFLSPAAGTPVTIRGFLASSQGSGLFSVQGDTTTLTGQMLEQ